MKKCKTYLLDEEIIQKIYDYADKTNRKYNAVIEMAITEFIKNHEKEDVRGISTGNTGDLSKYVWEVIGNIYENPELLEVNNG